MGPDESTISAGKAEPETGCRSQLQPAHQANLERMRKQFVSRIKTYAVSQLAAHLGLELQREALLALLGRQPFGFEAIGFCVAVVFMVGDPGNQ